MTIPVPEEKRLKPGKTKGLVLIDTGEGKGKTTAALGLMLRSWGHGNRVVMLQFIKNSRANFGEHRAARCIGIEIIAGGAGFARPGVTNNVERSKFMAQKLWDTAKEKINSGDYDLVVLDELSYPLQFSWLKTEEIIATLKQRPEKVHIVITGRGIPSGLLDFADAVTEMKEVKHHLRKGIKAQPGIEF